MKILVCKLTAAEARALSAFIARTTADDAREYGLTLDEYHVLSNANLTVEYRSDRAEEGKVLHTIYRLLANTSQTEHMGAGLSKKEADTLYYLYEEMGVLGFDESVPHPALAVPSAVPA